jgi:hypothetical protein
MKKDYEGVLRCATCASEDFEFNENKSYIKCTNCGREYFGGYNELLEYNLDVQKDVLREVKEDVESELQKIFNGTKYINIK